MSKIGAAVIGVGIYGEVHVRNYKANPNVELISIWSRSPQRAKETGEKYGCQYTTDLDAIADDKKIDIVSIATPDFAHTEPAIKMLKAGKHVLLEKPMATSVKECEQIIEARNSSGRKLMINFHQRWYPPMAKAREIMQSGKIGTPVASYARLSDTINIATEWLSWADRSGPEWFLLPHIIDDVRWVIGQDAVRVYAQGKKGLLQSKGIDCYDIVQAQVEFTDSIASFESSWILPKSWRCPPIEMNLVFNSSKGRIGLQSDNEGINVTSDTYRTPLVYDFTTEDMPVNYFIDCVLNNIEPSATGEDGLANTRIIEAITKSLSTGQSEKIT